MVKRKLDEQEIEYTEKGIKRIENEIEELEEQAEFNRLTIDFQKVSTTYQEAVKPYLIKKKEQENEKVMGTIKEQIARNKDTLANLQDQISHGVTIKQIKEVKNGD